MKEKFTPNAQNVLAVAYELSERMGQGYIGTEHLLIALTQCDGVAKDILLTNGVQAEKLLELAKQLIVLGGAEEPDGQDSFSPMARKVLLQSEQEANAYEERLAGTLSVWAFFIYKFFLKKFSWFRRSWNFHSCYGVKGRCFTLFQWVRKEVNSYGAIFFRKAVEDKKAV